MRYPLTSAATSLVAFIIVLCTSRACLAAPTRSLITEMLVPEFPREINKYGQAAGESPSDSFQLAWLLSRKSPLIDQLGEEPLAHGSASDLPGLVSRLQPSVVTVFPMDNDGRIAGVGTGFAIAEHRIITAWHVVEDAQSVTIMTPSGTVGCATRVLAFDSQRDVAILDIDIALPALRLEQKLPRPAERAIVIGAPLGIQHSVSMGIVSGIRHEFERFGTVVQIDAAISPGNSGSPVINENGDVIGMACFKLTRGESLNFAIPAETLMVVLNDPSPDSRALTPCKDESRANIAESDEGAQLPPARFPEARNDSLWWFALGYRLQESGLLSQAIAAYTRCAELDPENYQVWNNLGMAWSERGMHSRAARYLKRATNLQPDAVEAWSNYGIILRSLTQNEEARKAFNTAVKIDSCYVPALVNRSRLNMDDGLLDEAVADLTRVVTKSRNDAEARYLLGEALRRNDRVQDAWREYEALLKLDSSLARQLYIKLIQ